MYKQAKRKYAILFLSWIIIIAGLVFTPIFAWRMDKSSANLTVNSSIIGSYFEKGNGTADTPYVIARPIQLYYFGWLQNLGYFDGDNDQSTTSDKKFYFTLAEDIDMSESLEYSTLPPIGTPEHPFVGVFNGQYNYTTPAGQTDPFTVGDYHVIKNATISNTGLSYIPTGGEDGMQYMGLFGVVGSMTDASVKGEIKNFAMDGVTVETADPDDGKTIVGIVAGYCNGNCSGIGVSNCTISIANGLGPAELAIHNTNPDTGVVTTTTETPETLSFSLIGFSDVSYQAYTISPIAGGNEFGGSLAMDDLYQRIGDARDDASATYTQYYDTKTIINDEDGGVTETYSSGHTYNGQNPGSDNNTYYYRFTNTEIKDEGYVTESYGVAKRYSGSGYTSTSDQWYYLAGGLSKTINRAQTINTITRTRYNAFTIGDGNGNYLVASSSATSNTTNSENATAWRFSNGASGGTFSMQALPDETIYYLRNNNGTLTMTSNSGNATNWTVSNGEITNNGYYLLYLDGEWKLWTETTYYYIDNGNGTYLNISNGNVVSSSTATTRWHIASNKVYYYNGTTKTYLYNNNGAIATTTNVNTATAWTINSTNHTMMNGGDYLVCDDGAWRFVTETTYYYLHNGDGTYLNMSNGNIASSNSGITKWHITSNKIYYYDGTTKTYLYNNNGVLTTTTVVGTANTWTIDSVSGTIKNGDYYLLFAEGEWIVVKEIGYYLINDGNSHYLNLTTNGIETGTSSNATRWYALNDKIYAYVNGTATYIYSNGGVLATTTNANTANTWTIANNNIKNGNYYLIYNNGWKLTEETDYTLISDGSGNYMNLTGGVIDIGTSSNATEWHITNDNKIYTNVNGTKTYIYNNGGLLATTTSSATATAWTIGVDSITNGGYTLVYQNGWKLTNETSYYLISDGNGHYLNLGGGGYEVGTSANAMGWHFTNGATGGKIYTYVNGTKTYMYNNAGNLATTTNENTASTWAVSNGQITNGGYYLVFDGNSWRLTNTTTYYTIHDGNGHYLNYSAGSFGTGTSSNATPWQFTSTTSGKIYTFVNGTETYLYNNGGNLTTTTNSNTATTWTIDNTNKNIKNNGYFLTYDGSSWVITNNVSYYKIHDNNNHYMNLTYSNSRALTAVGTSANATVWKFSNKSSGGYISAEVNNTTYYLNYVDGNMVPGTTQSTTWTVSGNTIYCTNSGTNYNIFCDGSCWTIVRNGLNSYYLVSSGNNYLSCSTSEIENETVRSYARKWEFTGSGSNNRYYISTQINGTNYWLRGYRSGSWGSYAYYIEATTTQDNRTEIRTDNNKTYLIGYSSRGLFGGTTNYYVRYNNGWTSLSSSQQTLTISNISSSTRNAVKVVNDVQYDLVAQYASGTYDMTNSISSNEYDLAIDIDNNNYNLIGNAPYTAFNTNAILAGNSYNITANMTDNSYGIVNVTTPTTTVWQNTVTTNSSTQTITGVDTYIPLTLGDDGKTSLKNTGYIIGGSNYDNVANKQHPGDIRVAYYGMSSLSASLNSSSTYNDSRLEVLTRTYKTSDLVRIYDDHNSNNGSVSSNISSYTKNSSTTNVVALGLDKYTKARNQLQNTLNGQSNVYGLHFMDAQISASRTVTIEKATINNEIYYNYAMPQDCIDFTLNTRGSINFFAGTYFTNNNTFFSLHKIERTDGVITSIKEISKIYGNPSNNGATYIYQYAGEGTPSYPSGYQLLFDTTWITSPTIVMNAMYYFEIPVNPGEYALGSVDNKNGAYLIYLDIGASTTALSDGTTLETAIKGIDFVTASSITSANIASTLGAITSSSNSSAVIVIKNRFEGDINFVRTDSNNRITITYTISDASSDDFIDSTKESNDTTIVSVTS